MSEHADENNANGPLAGVRVVECGVWHAGPGASAIMADLGAEVIKIESMDGDPERYHGSFGPMALGIADRANWNLLFEMSNRNKRAMCLNVTTFEGKQILHQLVSEADIFLTNLRTSTKPKLGIDYETLKGVNPRLVHLNISGFGPEGPFADAGGFDPMGQAISGMMFLSGKPEPSVLQVIVLDQLAAITASHAAITALYARERNGEGQEVHVSLYGSALWLMHANVLQSSIRGVNLDVSWERLNNPFSRTTFECGDGKWIMGTNHPEEKYWARFCEAVELPELATDPRFDTKEKRIAVNAELIAMFDAQFKMRPRAEWLEIMREKNVLFAPINTTQDVVNDEQALVNGYLTDYDHPYLGQVRIPGYPARFSSYEAGPRTPAPDLGQDTDDILTELGLSAAEIEVLRSAEVVR